MCMNEILDDSRFSRVLDSISAVQRKSGTVVAVKVGGESGANSRAPRNLVDARGRANGGSAGVSLAA